MYLHIYNIIICVCVCVCACKLVVPVKGIHLCFQLLMTWLIARQKKGYELIP